MTARTRKTPTAAKKTARKTATKKTTTAAKKTPTRTTRSTPTQTAPTTPRLSLVKPVDQRTTTVNLYKLPRPRRRLFVGPMGVNEQAAVRAALAAASTRLPISARAWNGSSAQLADGLLLIHNPGPDRTFTAHIACRHGAIHGYPIRNLHDLREARALTHACETAHAGEQGWDQAITHGVRPLSLPAVKVSHLADGLTTARKPVADTQPMNTREIATHIARQHADNDAPKEHPQP